MGFIYDLLVEFATEQRGWFVTFFVLPFSLGFDLWFDTRAWVIMKLFSAPKLHLKRVQDVSQQIQEWRKNGARGKLCTARGGWQSITFGNREYKSKSHQIRVNLFDILELNEKERWVSVEPLVNMGQLSHYLIPKGWTIPVLPEMDDLTVGGLLMGVGIETSCHKYGLFNDTVIEAEIVLPDGSVKVCSKTQNRDLFDALPWSYGTLGFLTSVRIRIIECASFVRVEYLPCSTLDQGVSLFRELSCSENPPDFVESLAFSKSQMVVMPANFVKCPGNDGPVNVLSRWYKPWFFKHVESMLESGKPQVEYIPLRDYYHRHTRSIFWELQDIIPFGNHPVYRWLLGWALPPKVSFLKLTQTEKTKQLYENKHVIQDMLVPMSRCKESLEVFHREFEIYPLWMCPYRAYDYTDSETPHRCFLKKPLNLEDGKDYEMYVDLGAYGTPQAVKDKREDYDTIAHSKKVEQYVLNVHGFQMLYATSYLNRDEFREMFDHKHHDAMKRQYDPSGAFPEVFEKTCKEGEKVFEVARV
jgi:delta24-sterol reductase